MRAENPPLRIPEGLGWWREWPGGDAWLERLPRLVAECAELWGLDVGPPVEPASISLVAPVVLADGTPAVLKVNFPEPESEHEADALLHWNGEGAVTLLAHDDERRALLVERCDPGTPLWALSEEDTANRIAAGVLGRLWRPPPPEHRFRLLATEAARWADELPRHSERLGWPFERALVDAAVDAVRQFGPSQGEPVVLHQDVHGGNVLLSARGWLAIDPKPLVGEREFDAASLLRDRRPELAQEARPARRIRRRLDLLTAELGLDRERLRGWAIAHALAWGVTADRAHDEMVACARWLLEA